MTKKDYELIADVLRCHSSDNYGDTDASLCRHMADALAKDNPRFDRIKFLVACGVDADNHDTPPSDDPIVAGIVAKLYNEQ